MENVKEIFESPNVDVDVPETKKNKINVLICIRDKLTEMKILNKIMKNRSSVSISTVLCCV